ncbi:hypothetical protein [uncultured Polaribacter sp.]|uniref:hypothetical protein n=1 Tax=uncultured Polaribacter sp. TaxID=174711 RepID=UPI002615DB4D|nr:hypothetical protein [uncultured Polaribacter sp.]
MNYQIGKPKDLDLITEKDVLENNVWLWTWEVGIEGDFDETWQVPLIGIKNIGNEFNSPIITLRIVETEIIASATFDFNEKKIYGIAFWEDNNWKSIEEYSNSSSIEFESLIKINGVEKTKFKMNDKKTDEAFMENINLKSWWKFWK